MTKSGQVDSILQLEIYQVFNNARAEKTCFNRENNLPICKYCIYKTAKDSHVSLLKLIKFGKNDTQRNQV